MRQAFVVHRFALRVSRGDATIGGNTGAEPLSIQPVNGGGGDPSRLFVCAGVGTIAAGAGIFIPAFALLSGLS